MAYLLEDYQNAVKRLEEILSLEKNPINRDSAIKRFELCFDLSWKTVKEYAREEGLECYSPRACFKIAFQIGLIDYNEEWFSMIDDRNATAHIYREEIADKVYSKLPNYLKLFETLFDSLVKKFG